VPAPAPGLASPAAGVDKKVDTKSKPVASPAKSAAKRTDVSEKRPRLVFSSIRLDALNLRY
jgi:hypothetical protein